MTPRRLPDRMPPRLRVEQLRPSVDGGRHPVKRTVGETVRASADVVRDGHDELRASLRWRRPGSARWHEAPMEHVDAAQAGVRWEADLPLDEVGRWTWTVRAWADPLASWQQELRRRVDAPDSSAAGHLDSALAEGAALLAAAAKRAAGDHRRTLSDAAASVGDPSAPIDGRVAAALDPRVVAAGEAHPDLGDAAGPTRPMEIVVEPELARFGAWYELFPRSWGGLAGVRRRLPALAELGFDVVYLPPIHPIGRTNRKGPNNSLVAGADDPGSPWAIGDRTGGHTAVHPELGTVDDLVGLVADARELGIEIALDLAIQCSADHPWLTEHPEWFFARPDGTLKYAENPPKKYQDIYNLDFGCESWATLWTALHDVVRCWIDRGVRVFRVDNPHTKPIPFWEWLIASVHDTDPDVVFLAEAFTKRAMMQQLAKVGFSQSYTYFTWKSSRAELTEYVQELAGSDEREYFRPNFFTNTPDILTAELQHGGPPAFVARLILAATLSPSYGVYSGYEHFEGTPVAEGSEEYLDSEKYQLRTRTLDGPLLPLISDLNRIRREHPALQHLDDITFLETHNDALIAYAKRHAGDLVLCVVNLDPYSPHEGSVVVPGSLGLAGGFTVHDRLTDERFPWAVGDNYVRLVPGQRPAHVFSIEP